MTGDLTTGAGGDAGKDSLAVIDSTITGNVNVNLGADQDLFIGAKLNVGGNLNLLLGDGNDVATVEVANVAGALNVDAGTGNDLLIGGFQSGGFNIQWATAMISSFSSRQRLRAAQLRFRSALETMVAESAAVDCLGTDCRWGRGH